jgi:DNA helicase-2/ATP-dependent DNA helicase PcrA
MSVNTYDFPSGISGDQYLPDKCYVSGKLNLEAETLAQLQAALSESEYDWYEQGVATSQARLDYARERLRLLYVGITRAKKELIITWNTGRSGKQERSLPFIALKNYWDKQTSGI